ncbi:hypothetical protein C9994_15550 [Marivirga lumbricoides]|uniref:Uncharacterized protein n=1 Tax=Marivirga lumbricoides TaxID=1046115 RepID=A0A2T4DC85_9BACT|nr:hypothetical protein C9994_15550 [Marivirga lumbricoides]
MYAEALKALEDWKNEHSEEKLDDLPFYMVGEVYNYSIHNGLNYTYDGDTAINFFEEGFKSMINFSLKWEVVQKPLDEVYSNYSKILNEGELKEKSVLNYLSSHDDGQPFDANRDNVFNTANYLLLAPGAAQIYYGDETARKLNAQANGDATLRSFMNWDELENNIDRKDYRIQEIQKHWQKLGQFRNNHPAIGAGVHQKLNDMPYTFARTYSDSSYTDKVVVVMDSGSNSIDVKNIFSEGEEIRNFYTGETAVVKHQALTFKKAGRIMLLEVIP